MKKYVFLLLLFSLPVFVYANDNVKPISYSSNITISDQPPAGIKIQIFPTPFSGPFRKYFYILGYTIINASNQDIKVIVRDVGIRSDEIIDLYVKKEKYEPRKNTSALGDTVDGIKEYGSMIGSVPLAELGTIYYIGSLPLAAMKTVCDTISKKDAKLLAKEYENIKDLEAKQITSTSIGAFQKKTFYGVYELDNPFPIVEVEYSNGEKYLFKILFPFSGAGKQ